MKQNLKSSPNKKCRYKCLSCEFSWEEENPRIFNQEPLASCPECNYIYIKWLNFEKDFDK